MTVQKYDGIFKILAQSMMLKWPFRAKKQLFLEPSDFTAKEKFHRRAGGCIE